MENTGVTFYTFTQQTTLDIEQAGSFPLQTSSQKSITMDDAVQWVAVVREFTNFLSDIYGYDISAKVFVQDMCWDTGAVNYTAVQDCE